MRGEIYNRDILLPIKITKVSGTKTVIGQTYSIASTACFTELLKHETKWRSASPLLPKFVNKCCLCVLTICFDHKIKPNLICMYLEEIANVDYWTHSCNYLSTLIKVKRELGQWVSESQSRTVTLRGWPCVWSSSSDNNKNTSSHRQLHYIWCSTTINVQNCETGQQHQPSSCPRSPSFNHFCAVSRTSCT